MQYRFLKSQHLRTAAEFERVYNSSAFAADDVLVMKGVANGLGLTRIGLSVSRKVGNAVVRNRWKRLIREAFRLAQHDLPVGLDLTIRPKAGAKADFARIQRSLPHLARRLASALKVPK